MIEKLKIKIHKGSIAYLMILCLTGPMVFIFGGIVPTQAKISHLERDMRNVRSEIEEQQLLHPVYDAIRARAQKKGGKVLVLPVKGKLAKDLIGEPPATISGMALKSGMTPIAVSSDFRTLANRSPFLLVNVSLRGDLFSFQNFLTQLGAVPYLEGIEEIQIQANANGLDYRLKVWLALN